MKLTQGSPLLKTTANDAELGCVLVVDDHATARESMADILRQAGHTVDTSPSALDALGQLQSRHYDVIITDLKMPGMNGLEFIRQIGQRKLEAQVVMVTAHASVTSAVEAMRHGAFDFIEKPFDADQLEQLVARAIRHGGLVGKRSSIPAAAGVGDAAMVGASAPIQNLRKRVAQIAPTNETALIMGESGVGKELVARSLHLYSRRAHQALVSLNCPALSPQLMESELFGHERGAFTGADAPRVGRFELADGGSILFDEVTEIDPVLQAKLLRVLQERSFERVGSSVTRSVDVRVLATTNRDLRHEVAAGRFREDLYFRLAVLPIHVPPLRDRREDIPALFDHFAARAASRLGHEPLRLSVNALDLLTNYNWPGNVRELENLVTRASVLSSSKVVRADDLQPWLIDSDSMRIGIASDTPRVAAGVSLQQMERQLIESTLSHFGGHRAKTAEALGIGLRTLTNKLREYGYAPRARVSAKAA